MNIEIHRCTNEIGGNCIEISTKTTRVILDFGMPLVNPDKTEFNFNQYKDLSNSELVRKKILPDVEGLYDSGKKAINAVIISHPHLDHYGFMNFVKGDIPVYIGEAAKELIEISNIFTPMNILFKSTHHYKHRKTFSIGDIKITPYLNDHSAFDAYSFSIEGEGKIIFYSGDFRSHGRKEFMFNDLTDNPPENIDYLMMEGTNISKQAVNKTEKDIELELMNLFNNSNKINLVYQAGQNIDRIVSVFKACKASNKTLVLDVYLAYIMSKLVKTTGNRLPFPSKSFPNIKVFFSSYASKQMVNSLGVDSLYEFQPYKITKEEIDVNCNNIVMIVRPSLNIHLKGLKNIDGGNLIYSLWEGYKDKGSTKRFIDDLVNNRSFKYRYIHTSGHADVPAMKKMVNGLKPKKIIPIHTFHKDMYQTVFNYPVVKLNDGVSFCC